MEEQIDGGLPGRLAAAPISWGVCEVPGWGLQLPPDRVLAEMADLGIAATELGALGWLPEDSAAARALLDRYALQLVGGFVPVVVHERAVDVEYARRAAAHLASTGGELFVAATVQDLRWSAPAPLDADSWARAGEHVTNLADVASAEGVELVLHPHAGTVLETAADVELALEHTNVPWCFDTGHLLIGGVDPVEFVGAHGDRIGHVHFKDVRLDIVERLRSGELSLVQAVQAGLFQPLGTGDARIAEVVEALRRSGYDRWLVLEQDLAITGSEPPAGAGPALDVASSIQFLFGLASAQDEAVH
ncbi:TIM barrel protein [Solirubrobacter soli]|uniref:TIM barrel protein n=1 Tax=Solirubrobacter soli TaxID=363832 RepID=UPI000407C766|nr:TIM barrel protein [Solirubrobacter soli]